MNDLSPVFGSILDMNQEQIDYFDFKLSRRTRCKDLSVSAGLSPQTMTVEQSIKTWGSVKTVCEMDMQVLKTAGITTKQIADKMMAISEKAKYLYDKHLETERLASSSKNLSQPLVVVLDHKFKITGFDTLLPKMQTCPFHLPGESCAVSQIGYEIENMNSKKKIYVAEIVRHAIQKHDFFSRKQSAYRIEPEKLLEVLELMPDVDYSKELEISEKEMWIPKKSKYPCPKVHEEELEKNALSRSAINSTSTAYIMNESIIKNDVRPSFYRHIVFSGSPRDLLSEKTYLHLLIKNEKEEVVPVDGGELNINSSQNGVIVFARKKTKVIKLNEGDSIGRFPLEDLQKTC